MVTYRSRPNLIDIVVTEDDSFEVNGEEDLDEPNENDQE